MPWGSLSSAHQILVTLAMKGGPAYGVQARAAARATGALGTAVLKTSVNMHTASKRTWAYNQALYTARRYAFYATIATTALVAAVAKLGFGYLSTMQTARVALRPAFNSTKDLTAELGKLYRLAALSPFLFGETVTAFRSMYPSFKAAGLSVGLTNNTLKASMDALAESGHLTEGTLKRVSVQYQHMANVGRPTGQILQALGRDGLPVFPALRKELGLTGRSLTALAGSGLTAAQVIRAINRYIETSPLYKGAGMRQANRTLAGSWAQFKDILAQASGRGEAGLFGGLQRVLTSVNYSLAPLISNNRPVTLYNIADAIDRAVSPRTHIMINLFLVMQSALKSVIVTVGLFAAAVSFALRPFDYLSSLFGANRLGARLFGTALGILVGLFVVYRTGVALAAVATGAWEVAVLGAEAAAKMYAGTIWLVTAAMEFQAGLAGKVLINRFGTLVTYTSKATRAGYALRTMMISMIGTEEAATMTTRQLAIAWLGVIWPIAAIVAVGAALVVLYFRWKAFHDIVDSVYRNLIYYSPLIAAALTVAFGPLGTALTAIMLIIRYHKQLADWAGVGSSGSKNRSALAQPTILGIGFSHASPHEKHKNLWQKFIAGDFAHLPGLAMGGNVMSSGRALVGERGPEILHLPRGAQIQPLGRNVLDGAGSLNIHIYPQDIYLDGKQIATVTATAVIDKKARM